MNNAENKTKNLEKNTYTNNKYFVISRNKIK